MKHFLTFFLTLISFSALGAPRVSIITSIFKGEQFIRAFLEDITQQTIFKDCELIIINANSPENEEPIILNFKALYPNIHYIRLDYDPGLYGVWNMGIDQAHGEYLTNANVDDRLDPEAYAINAAYLDANPAVDLVYAEYYVTHTPPLTTFTNFPREKIAYTSSLPEASLSALKTRCFVGPQPMWRKSLHSYAGLFNATFKIAGDWEMWLRAYCRGARFRKIPRVLGLYYENPTGLSNLVTDKRKIELHRREIAVIHNTYKRRTVKHKEKT